MGIWHTIFTSYCPQSNVVAEQMDFTLMDKARAMLKGPSILWGHWGKAINYEATLYN